jgi:hypothetical protein
MDEKEINLSWLESAYESFKDALEARDFDFAKAVMEDVKGEGFESAAVTMRYELVKAQSGHLAAIKSIA